VVSVVWIQTKICFATSSKLTCVLHYDIEYIEIGMRHNLSSKNYSPDVDDLARLYENEMMLLLKSHSSRSKVTDTVV